ncbi:MAG: peptide chain release factor N(5)-glutamine methyltransferase [Geminicoccaceae bacterium]
MAEATIQDAIAAATEHLIAAGVAEARQDAWYLLCHATGKDRATLMAHHQEHLDPRSAAAFSACVERRCRREPVAHILGTKEFWSLPFEINADVLSPRPDSEVLIETALGCLVESDDLKTAPLRLLDLGTGSGCLLLALLHELPGAIGVGADISNEALAVARANGQRLGVDARVHWVQAAWGTALDDTYDLIVSNPPYIERGDFAELLPEIRLFEPYQALVAGDDGLDAYRALAPDIKRLLSEKGIACLEIGLGQAEAVSALMAEVGLSSIACRQDLAGIGRCLVVAHDQR